MTRSICITSILPRNTVTRTGQYHLIDFTYLDTKHCGCNFDDNWMAGEAIVNVGMIDCGVLESYAFDMNIWYYPGPEPRVIIG